MKRRKRDINTMRRMESIGQRIRRLRLQHGMSQAKLGELVHKSQAAISQAESGIIHDPKFLLSLAEVLCGGDAMYLHRGEPTGKEPGLINAPLISWVEAGKLTDTEDPYLPGHAEQMIPVTYKHGNLIALRIEGRSLDKAIEPGAIVIVDLEDKDLVDGKYYIFRHGGQATAKMYRAGPPASLVPNSTDPDYLPIVPNGEIEVIGRLVKLERDL